MTDSPDPTPAWTAYLRAINLHRAGLITDAILATYRNDSLREARIIPTVAAVAAGRILVGRVTP